MTNMTSCIVGKEIGAWGQVPQSYFPLLFWLFNYVFLFITSISVSRHCLNIQCILHMHIYILWVTSLIELWKESRGHRAGSLKSYIRLSKCQNIETMLLLMAMAGVLVSICSLHGLVKFCI